MAVTSVQLITLDDWQRFVVIAMFYECNTIDSRVSGIGNIT